MPIGSLHFGGVHERGYAARDRRAASALAGEPASSSEAKVHYSPQTHSLPSLKRYSSVDVRRAEITAAEFARLRQDPMKDPHCVENLRAMRGGTNELVDATLFHRRLRKFDQERPIVSRVAAVASVAALATVIGTLCGASVDALAHLSDRKNDNAGRLFGTLVGCVVALTHGLMLFGVPRRMEMAMRAGVFRRDDKTPPGIALQLIENASLPLAASVERNGKSNLGLPHSKLRVECVDTLNAVNRAIKYGLTRNEFDAHFRVAGREAPPPDFLPVHRMQNDVPRLGLRKGDYVVPKFLSFGHLLERDFNNRWDHQTKSLDKFIGSIDDAHQFQVLDDRGKVEKVRKKLAQYLSSDKDAARLDEKLCLSLARYFADPGLLAQHNNFTAFEYRRHDEYVALSHFFQEMIPMNEAALKSWARIDEACKVAGAFTGLRPAGMHTFVRNVEDSVVRAVSSFADPNMQGQNAGMSAPMYLPMMVLGSTVTVLLLGMSASPATPLPLPEDGVTHLKKHVKRAVAAAVGAQNAAPPNPAAAAVSGGAPAPVGGPSFGAYLNGPQAATTLAA